METLLMAQWFFSAAIVGVVEISLVCPSLGTKNRQDLVVPQEKPEVIRPFVDFVVCATQSMRSFGWTGWLIVDWTKIAKTGVLRGRIRIMLTQG